MWRNTQVNWDDYRCFLTLAKTGSFSRAARLLHVDHTTVGRRVAALEVDLGIKLVERLAREVRLTAEGHELATLGLPIEEAMASVERAAAGGGAALAGPVHISAPPGLASLLLAPKLVSLHRQYPDIKITMSSDKDFANLNRREADIALRLSRPLSNGLVTRKLRDIPFFFFASHTYDIAEDDWEFITYLQADDILPQQSWLMQHIGSRTIALRCSDAASQVQAAASGLGVALLPDYLGYNDTRLRKCPSRLTPPRRELWMVVHDDIRHAPRVRVVLDFLIGILTATQDLELPNASEA
ncbi:LysR family transcriptional regulator [Agrobacterium vitis]|nr:LysR family transcriptional regulator [Agrobacterium vitis]MVA52568.1 LysR family transcriptional regulator [Agrobacterium vitis]